MKRAELATAIVLVALVAGAGWVAFGLLGGGQGERGSPEPAVTPSPEVEEPGEHAAPTPAEAEAPPRVPVREEDLAAARDAAAEAVREAPPEPDPDIQPNWDPGPPIGVLRGKVLDATSRQPVPEFRLRLVPPEAERRAGGSSPSVAIRAADGTFELPVTAAGTWVLEARSQAHAPAWSAALDIREGTVLEGLVLLLGEGGALHGRVYGADGAPAAGAEVMASNQPIAASAFAEAAERRAEALGLVARVHTDAHGVFRVEHLEPGTYRVTVRQHPWSDRVLERVEVHEAVDLDLGSLSMERGAALEGVAMDEEGRPLPGATVQAVTQGGLTRRASTDAAGHYRFDGLTAGRWHVAIVQFAARDGGGVEDRLERAARSGVELDLVVGQTATQELRLGGTRAP